jgi:tRNA modification GTPase
MTRSFTSGDTIAAISTPPGTGAIGMVRITGPEAQTIGQKIFSPAASGNGPFPTRKAVFGQVHQPGRHNQPIDLAVLCFYAGPKTYTGEDTVEITTHGGPLIMRTLLDAAVAGGARLAEPGEFTRRAFLNGRMDLSQAEAVASLIFASTEEAREVMLRQVEGAMGKEAREMRERLLDIKVNLEATIDFPEDVGELEPESLLMTLAKVSDVAHRLIDTARKGIALDEGFKVVIAGAPNVGKSCLLNALLGEKRAIVHEKPGTTRDYVEGVANIEGIPIRVIDTAGIRSVVDPVEGEGVERTRELMGSADMLVIVLDTSRPVHPDEEALLDETRKLKRVIAANKTDLNTDPGFTFPEDAIGVSALKGNGIGKLKRAIHDVFTGDPSGSSLEKGVVTTARQAEALGRIINSCSRVRTALLAEAPPELVAVGVDEALVGIGELTGEVTTEDVLGEIFSRFCIGK